jgi:hypothetical protein
MLKKSGTIREVPLLDPKQKFSMKKFPSVINKLSTKILSKSSSVPSLGISQIPSTLGQASELGRRASNDKIIENSAEDSSSMNSSRLSNIISVKPTDLAEEKK